MTGKEEGLEAAAQAVLAQIREKKYGTELAARGFAEDKIVSYGIAFSGNAALVLSDGLPA